jgi:biotin synthase
MTLIRKLREDSSNLTVQDIVPLLTAEGALQEELFEQARSVRREAGQDGVVLRGVIEISNYCQKGCDYCAMRTANKEIGRYTLSADDILLLARKIKEAGITIAFLQGGQNPGNDRLLEEVVPVIKKELGMNVLLCIGERPKETYERFFSWGADSYILKYETSDPDLYHSITSGRLEKRLQCIEWIRAAGMKVGTGNIVGLPGQSLEILANDILLDARLKPDFVSSSPFIPNSNTPLQNHPRGSVVITLNTIAILRIILASCLIPSVSALESVRSDGQTAGLNAGANVLTVNFTPREKRDLYRIYSSSRFVVSLDHAMNSIARAGLRVRA